jgi:hypothetical protein
MKIKTPALIWKFCQSSHADPIFNILADVCYLEKSNHLIRPIHHTE